MLKLTYRIYDGEELTKTGQYAAEVIGPMKNNFDTHREFIQGYMTNLKSNFEYHSEKAMLRMLDELY